MGDDAQSIYAFRGANIKNILNFEKDYPELKVFRLEQNYRSTKTIVDAASDIIKKNKYQLKKEIWTDNEHGNKIKVFKAIDEAEEGRYVAASIFEERAHTHISLNDIAILYRTNSQSRAFEEGLSRLDLSYKIIGGIQFYQRKEVKDLIAYYRLALNPNDEEALKRVINYPVRGIGDTTLNKIIVIANENDISLWDVIENIGDFGFDGRVKKAVGDWAMMIKRFHLELPTRDAYELANEMAIASGLIKHLSADKTLEGIGRLDNIQALLGRVKEFSEKTDLEEKHLGIFIRDIALLSEEDKDDDNAKEKITMMTIHAAKGLEFPYVYIVGLEENLFPSQMSLTSREDLEEERRLFYVALTRAEKKVFLSYAEKRFKWGQMAYSEASRFIEEINPTYLDYQLKTARQAPSVSQVAASAYTSPKPLKQAIKVPTYQPMGDFKADNLSGLESGMDIEHNRFGKGKVVAVEGNADDKKATIHFEEIGEKQILLKYAKMKIL